MTDAIGLIRSALPGIAWPAIPAADGAHALALQFQLELSQWYDPERLRDLQLRQLDVLLRHACATVPYYRERFHGIYDPDEPLTHERFGRLPVLTRGVLQGSFEALKSAAPPPKHGPVVETRSSGSTGTPVRVLKTALCELIWQGMALREHLWHRRDLRGKLAVIRHGVEAGEAEGWGFATDAVATTGPMALLPTSAAVDAQLRWLEQQQPDYLLTYPSSLAELARLALARGTRLTGLREIMTFGETLGSEVRPLCREAWGVAVIDAYSTQEVGYLALQCPGHEHYHVQSESALLEILDNRGKPCAPGQVGLVAVTTLHNFAMPLVRYVVGDYAEAGPPCGCGRGLPVLARILGRVRNTLVTASGERYWPSFGTHGMRDVAPVLQHQFVQKSVDVIEARLVTERPLTRDEEARLTRHVLGKLPGRFEVRFAYVREISRGPGGKYEDFVSEIAGSGGA